MQLSLSRKYRTFKESDSRYFIVTGGRGSGKSFAINTLVFITSKAIPSSFKFVKFLLESLVNLDLVVF